MRMAVLQALGLVDAADGDKGHVQLAQLLKLLGKIGGCADIVSRVAVGGLQLGLRAGQCREENQHLEEGATKCVSVRERGRERGTAPACGQRPCRQDGGRRRCTLSRQAESGRAPAQSK